MPPQDLVQEQLAKLKEHLYLLDSITCSCRRICQFKMLEPGMACDTVPSKKAELAEACAKSDLLVKLAKSLMASVRAAATPQAS